MLEAGELFPLDPCVHDDRYFNTLNVQDSYPAAGSFVTFLLGPVHTDPQALERFRAFLAGINEACSGETVRERFLEIYGITLEEMEASWHQFPEGRCEEDYHYYCRCSSLPT